MCLCLCTYREREAHRGFSFVFAHVYISTVIISARMHTDENAASSTEFHFSQILYIIHPFLPLFLSLFFVQIFIVYVGLSTQIQSAYIHTYFPLLEFQNHSLSVCAPQSKPKGITQIQRIIDSMNVYIKAERM